MNPFEQTYGPDLMKKPLPLAILFSLALVLGLLMASKGVEVAIVMLVLPFAALYLVNFFIDPRIGIITIIAFGFFVNGLPRYVPATWGLLLDGLLVMMYLALFFKSFKVRIPWEKAQSQLTILASIWLGYALLQAFNPEAASIKAWFYAVRGVALYQWLIIPLCFVLFNRPKDMMVLFYGMGWNQHFGNHQRNSVT